MANSLDQEYKALNYALGRWFMLCTVRYKLAPFSSRSCEMIGRNAEILIQFYEGESCKS